MAYLAVKYLSFIMIGPKIALMVLTPYKIDNDNEPTNDDLDVAKFCTVLNAENKKKRMGKNRN